MLSVMRRWFMAMQKWDNVDHFAWGRWVIATVLKIMVVPDGFRTRTLVRMMVRIHRNAASIHLGKRKKQDEIALVPTMGYLHDGHAALIRRAAELAPRVVVTVFVNPLQFGPSEDFKRYPRDPARDRRIASKAGATDLFIPAAADILPRGMQFLVNPGPMANVLCGKSRPGHFAGVATIVAKLFNIVQPTTAVFGWKDAQQLIIIRKMVEDLNMPVRIEGLETVREADGLAMSSRNAYLSTKERRDATWLSKALFTARELNAAGETRARTLIKAVKETLERNTAARIDYVDCVSLADLTHCDRTVSGASMLAVAAWFGKTRLIDNIRF